MDMGYKLPVDINSHAFSKFTSVYFKVLKYRYIFNDNTNESNEDEDNEDNG